MIPAIKTEFKGQWDWVGIPTFVLLAFSVFLGGASRVHAGPLALVELAAIPLLCMAGWRVYVTGAWRQNAQALVLLSAVVALPLLQLVPLPPQIWTSLPMRDQMALALELAAVPQGWASLSVTPDATLYSALALIPPVAMFLALMVTPLPRRRLLATGYVLLAAVSIILGAAQLASGGERLFPYATTDAGNMVGFFANRNHLATFVLMALPIAAVALTHSRARGARAFERGLWMFGLYAFLAVIAIGAIRSRAGIILIGPTLIGSLALVWRASGGGTPKRSIIAVAAGMALALAAVAAFGLTPILARFDSQVLAQQGRLENWPIVLEVAGKYQPLGSGIGSFDPVYRSVEPLEKLDFTFFNHAHNEYLEIWLEAGWLGIALLVAVFAWWLRAWLPQWTLENSRRSEGRLALGAGLAVGVVILHSVLDYPIRTETIAVFTAFCLGLLTPPPAPPVDKRPSRDGRSPAQA